MKSLGITCSRYVFLQENLSPDIRLRTGYKTGHAPLKSPSNSSVFYSEFNLHGNPFLLYPLATTSLTMHKSFFASLVLAATLVTGLPVIQERSPGFPIHPSFPTGGNAQTGSSGNVNGGDVVNEGWKIQNYPWASKQLLFVPHDELH